MRVGIALAAVVLGVLTGCGASPTRTVTTTSSTATPTTLQGSGGSDQGHPPAARDSFRGSVSSATGAYAGEGGRAAIALEVRGSGQSRPVRLTFHSLPCQGAPQCLELDGSVVGVIVAGPRGTPDTGRSFSLRATGRLTTLGQVTVTGIAHGTGFISRGHELLELTLVGGSGHVMLRGESPTVRGFSSP